MSFSSTEILTFSLIALLTVALILKQYSTIRFRAGIRKEKARLLEETRLYRANATAAHAKLREEYNRYRANATAEQAKIREEYRHYRASSIAEHNKMNEEIQQLAKLTDKFEALAVEAMTLDERLPRSRKALKEDFPEAGHLNKEII